MTKQDLIDLLIINDAADDIADSISSVFGEIGEILDQRGNYEERASKLLGSMVQ